MSRNTIMVIVLVVGLGIIIGWQFIGRGTPKIDNGGDGSFQVTSGGTDTDSDNDGASDWEELLWGYDPDDPDTGDEGRLDGIKIDEKKALALETIGVKQTGTPPEENLGDQFGQNIYSSLLLLSEAGALNDQSMDLLKENASSALLEYGTAYANTEYYALVDFVVLPDTDESANLYISSLNDIHTRYSVNDEELLFLRDFMENPNEDDLTKQQSTNYASKYENFSAELASLQTPESFLPIHYQLTNGIATLGQMFKNIAAENRDVTKIVVDATLYLPTIQKIEAAYEKIGNFGAVFR